MQQESSKARQTNAWQGCDELPLLRASRSGVPAHATLVEPLHAGRAGGGATQSRQAGQTIHGRVTGLEGVTALPCSVQLAAREDSSALRGVEGWSSSSADLPAAKESSGAQLGSLGSGWEQARVEGEGKDCMASVDADQARPVPDGEAGRCGQAARGARSAEGFAGHSSREMMPPETAQAPSNPFQQCHAKQKVTPSFANSLTHKQRPRSAKLCVV